MHRKVSEHIVVPMRCHMELLILFLKIIFFVAGRSKTENDLCESFKSTTIAEEAKKYNQLRNNSIFCQ